MVVESKYQTDICVW